MLFCVWLLSYDIIFKTFIYVGECQYLIFVAEHAIDHILVIISSVGGYLGCFYFSVIVWRLL